MVRYGPPRVNAGLRRPALRRFRIADQTCAKNGTAWPGVIDGSTSGSRDTLTEKFTALGG